MTDSVLEVGVREVVGEGERMLWIDAPRQPKMPWSTSPTARHQLGTAGDESFNELALGDVGVLVLVEKDGKRVSACAEPLEHLGAGAGGAARRRARSQWSPKSIASPLCASGSR